MTCGGSTGLITNGRGGYLNASTDEGGMMANFYDGSGEAANIYGQFGPDAYTSGLAPMYAINTPNVVGVSTPVNQWGAAVGGPQGVVTGGTGVNVNDLNEATGSYMDASGSTPVYSSGASVTGTGVTKELCDSIKCGAPGTADVDLATKFACSETFGAGVWNLCLDSQCAPYRGNACSTPTTGAVQNPTQPITQHSLVTPFPTISGGNLSVALNRESANAPVTSCGVGAQWIAGNPMLAVAALGALFLLLKGAK